ncbi:hypothetical protein ACTQZR_12835 [Catenibacterium mitsuokai]|uniref:hypothetical protein n=1 Tax=Catenibacterium mitsuokai TaxID=100886 RepID=UPI003F89E2E4
MTNKYVKAVSKKTIEEERTTLSLSLTVSDKKKLKMLAMENDTTIASIIHGWIEAYSEKERK